MEQVLEFVGRVLGRLFGTQNERMLRRYWRIVTDQINPLEARMAALPDAAFPQLTASFKKRLEAGEDILDILPEAFAAVREASRRTLKMRHFDVQLIGGIVLHEGKIAEMGTGEGKTLVATLPAYLNALTGRGVHIVTVNDYLARRDGEWVGPIFEFLFLTVDCIDKHKPHSDERKIAYNSDITY